MIPNRQCVMMLKFMVNERGKIYLSKSFINSFSNKNHIKAILRNKGKDFTKSKSTLLRNLEYFSFPSSDDLSIFDYLFNCTNRYKNTHKNKTSTINLLTMLQID